MRLKVPCNFSSFRLLVFLLLFCSSSLAQKNSPEIILPSGPMTLQAVFTVIEGASGYHIYWPDGVLDPGKIVFGMGRRISLEGALQFYLGRQGLTWRIKRTTIFIRKQMVSKYADEKKSGHFLTIPVTVKNEFKFALPYANLKVGSRGHTIFTGADGTAVIRSAAAGDTLYCTYAGMKPETVGVFTSDTVHIVLKAEESLKAEVVAPYIRARKAVYSGNIGEVPHRHFIDQPVSNPQMVLAGAVAGVLVTQRNGVYGSNIDVMVRGKNSILNGHDPFYIIDGVPFAPGLQSVSNIPTGNSAAGLNPFSFISKEDIEYIQVLKDADATAIYGSRGANGVIIITTRKPGRGTPRLSFKLEKGICAVTRLPPMMDIHGYTKMRREALQNDGLAPTDLNAPELTKWDTTRNTDWQKYFVKGLGNITKAHADVSGGNGTDQFFIGANGTRESNVFNGHPAHDFFTFDGRALHNSSNGRLYIDLAGLAGWDKNAQYTSDVSRLQFLAPNAPDLLGEDGRPVFKYRGVRFGNPLSFTGDKYQAHSQNFLLSTDIHYRLLDSLFIKMTAGFNDMRTREFSIHPGWNQDPAYEPVRSSCFAEERYRSWILEPRLEYSLRMGSWKVNMLAGGSRQGQRASVSTLSAYGFPNDSTLASPAMADSLSPDSSLTDYLYTAYFGQMTFNWRGCRMLNVSWRRDGSSRFSGGKRYGNFGAIGLGWAFSEEPFFRKALPVVSSGKLRASYGVTGNDGIGGGQGYLESWSPTSSLLSRYTTNASSSANVNPDVNWEYVRKMDISLDWGFLENRLLFSATWYLNHSDHQLLPDNLQTPGNDIKLYNRPVVLQNRGWEFNVMSNNIRSSRFRWTTTLNASFPVSKLVAFPGLATSPFSELIVGESLSAFKAYHYIGINPLTGVFAFEDRNGDGVINNADRTLLAKMDVTCFAGMTNVLSWGNWDASATVEAKAQTGVSYEAAVYAVNRPGSIMSGLYSNQTTDMAHRWTKPGDTGPYQRLTTKALSEAGRAIGNYLSSSGILANASYIRLKTLSLSYRLPKLLKTGDGRIYLQGDNLLTLTPYKGADPGNQSILAIPPLRTILVGMELKF